MNEIYFDIFFIITISVALIVRIYPLLRFKIKSVDNYYHLLVARQIWREKRIPHRLSSFLFGGTYAYPPLFHVLLSPFAGNMNTKRENLVLLIAPIADVLSGMVLYFLLENLLGKPVALVSTIIFVITPFLIIESLPVTPRTLAALFLNLFMLIIFLYSYNHNYWLFIGSVFCVPIILLTHKMATQSLFFASIASSIAFLLFDPSTSIFVIVSLIIGFTVTFVLSKGFYRKVLRGHKAMLRYHFTHGDYKGEKRFGNPIQIFQRLPWLMMLPVTLVLSYTQPFTTHLPFVPLIWGLIFVTLTIFWKYGDNYRYLVYAVAPLSIVFAILTWSLPDPWKLLVITLSISLCMIRLIFFFSRRVGKGSVVTEDLLDCLRYIKNQQEHSSFGCVPVSLNYPSAFYTNKSVLGAEAAPEPWEKGIDFSHFFRDENLLLELMSNYDTHLYLVNMNDPAGSIFESLLKKSKKIRSKLVYSCGECKIYELGNESNQNEPLPDIDEKSASG